MKCVPVRLREHTVAQIDLLAKHRGVARAAVIQQIVEARIAELEIYALAKAGAV